MVAISQMERELRAERTAAGRSSGRPRTDEKKLQQAKVLFDGGHTVTEACQTVGIGKRTFFRHKASLE